MRRPNLYWLLIFSFCFTKCNLEDQSNEYIPNYSITLSSLDVCPNMNSDIIVMDDNTYIMAVEYREGEIRLVEFQQSFDEIASEWSITIDTLTTIEEGNLSFFDRLNDQFLIGYVSSDKEFRVQLLDDSWEPQVESVDWQAFIDTAYNEIDSLRFENYAFIPEVGQIAFGGKVFSQGTYYSCVIFTNISLEPLQFRTYFEESTIKDLIYAGNEKLLLLNNNANGTSLIRDGLNGMTYAKYELFSELNNFATQDLETSSIIYLTGINKGVGRIIEFDLESESTFVNEIEIHEVEDVKAILLDRNKILVGGIQHMDEGQYLFSSELGDSGSIWCKRDRSVGITKVLDVEEMPAKGILMASIIKQNDIYLLHFVRIDEEGAQFNNPFTENCI